MAKPKKASESPPKCPHDWIKVGTTGIMFHCFKCNTNRNTKRELITKEEKDAHNT